MRSRGKVMAERERERGIARGCAARPSLVLGTDVALARTVVDRRRFAPAPRTPLSISRVRIPGNLGADIWRRERDSHLIKTSRRISNLRIQKKILSPTIPTNPHSCHWIRHWKSPSRPYVRLPFPPSLVGSSFGSRLSFPFACRQRGRRGRKHASGLFINIAFAR